MKRTLLYLFFLVLLPTFIQAQERPKIDKKVFSVFFEMKRKQLTNKVNKANKFYKKEVYDEAFKLYQDVYNEVDTVDALNYRLGVSALMAVYPELSILYLSQSDPSVAKDYYLRVGEAYQLNHQYEDAYNAYDNYNQALGKCKRRKFSPQFIQLQRECQFGAVTVKDSLPYFVTNLGGAVNSYFDEYSPVILPDSKFLFFTSRQPEEVIRKPVNRSLMSENIKYTNYEGGSVVKPQYFNGVDQSGNVSVAGADHSNKRMFYYKGARRSGSIYSVYIQPGKGFKHSKIKGAVNGKTVHETYLSISSQGDAAFVSNKKRYTTGYDIYFSESATKRRVKRAVPADVSINTPHDERSVTFSPDGNTIYFSSNGHEGMGGYDIYKAHRQPDGTWSEPINLGYPINTAADELYYFPTSDSLVALMASSRPGGYGGLDIYSVVKDIRIPFDLWGEVVDEENGKSVSASISVIDADTKEPILTVANDSLSGEYFAHLEDVGNYRIQAEAPGYLNQLASIEMPEKRNERVRKDFQMQRLATPFTVFGEVKNKANGAPVQAEIILTHLESGKIVARGYTNSTDGSYSLTLGDKLNMAMQVNATNFFDYSDTLKLRDHRTDNFKKDLVLERSKVVYTVTGVVSDSKDKTNVPASLSFYEPGEQVAMLTAYADSTTGKYIAVLEEEGPFIIEINADGYFFSNMPLVFPVDSSLLIRNISLQKMSAGSKIVVENILFNTGKATLMPQSFVELNKLARLLSDNEEIRIEVSGHTDNVGSANLNKRLSRSRAESVRNYLREQGVDASRMEFEGYGFDKPIESNDTPDGRAANRRVEIEVIE